ncbi:MAG: exosome complex exonuclease Rrp41 [archaeon]|nr:MAG: exosome complex exonuclease Rrp41 [archaeon]
MAEKFKRPDGRKPEETRKIEAKVGIIPRADGSASFSFGKSKAIAAVYGPRQLIPRHLENPEKGVLRCNYTMLSFSVSERMRPGPSRRSQEISHEIAKALEPAVLLDQFPNTVIDVFIQIIEADASTRCAAVNAASMALANAGIPMKELIGSVSGGKLGKTIIVDLTKDEEDYKIKEEKAATDVATAFLGRSGKLSLLHMDGDLNTKELKEALELSKKTCLNIVEIQKKALKKVKEK